MSRIKAGRLISSALAVLLFLNPVVFASAPQDIIDVAQLTPQQINYQTTEVERGSLIQETSVPAMKYYPLTHNIRFEQNNAKFVEFVVKKGDTVKSGDILAKFTIAGSDAEFTRMELNLQRTNEQTAEGIREREQEITKKRAEIAKKRAEIAARSAEIAARSTEIAEVSDEIADGNDEITDGSNEATDGSNETTGGSDEITDGGDEITDGGDETTDGSDEITDGSNEATDGGDETTDGSDEITDGSDESTDGRDEIAEKIDEYEKKLLELSLEKLEIELEQFKYRQKYSADQQRKAYEKEKTRRATDVLISPVDGVVSELAYKKVDDAVSPDETLVVISSGEVMLLEVKNDSGELRYNMPVNVQIGTSQEPVFLTGRIVAADDAIPEDERTGYAFIQLDSYNEAEHAILSPKVSAQTVRLDNVLLIRRTAATLEAGKHYVNKLTDGMVQKRFVELGMNNIENVWVLAGVEEGETLILD